MKIGESAVWHIEHIHVLCIIKRKINYKRLLCTSLYCLPHEIKRREDGCSLLFHISWKATCRELFMGGVYPAQCSSPGAAPYMLEKDRFPVPGHTNNTHTRAHLYVHIFCLHPSGLCIPANNTIFIKSISEKLAEKEPHLTLEFLEECIQGFGNSNIEMKHLCLEYITPWLPNLTRYLMRN